MTAAPSWVPYVAPFSEEHVNLDLAFTTDLWAVDGRRLSYQERRLSDRMFDVLWARQDQSRRGRALLQEMHTLRQREVMLGRLCQVCQGSAEDERGLWWLFPTPVESSDAILSKPPTCPTCIREAVTRCPVLKHSAYAYTSTADWSLYGVVGHQFVPTPTGVKICYGSDGGVLREIPFEARRAISYTLARALIVHVTDLRPQAIP